MQTKRSRAGDVRGQHSASHSSAALLALCFSYKFDNCTASGLNLCPHANGQCYRADQYCDKDNHKVQDCLAEDDKDALEYCQKNAGNVSVFSHSQCWSACYFRFKDAIFPVEGSSILLILFIVACSIIGLISVGIFVAVLAYKTQIISKVTSKLRRAHCLHCKHCLHSSNATSMNLALNGHSRAINSQGSLDINGETQPGSVEDQLALEYFSIDSSEELSETEIDSPPALPPRPVSNQSQRQVAVQNASKGPKRSLLLVNRKNHPLGGSGNLRHARIKPPRSERNGSKRSVQNLYHNRDRTLQTARNQIHHQVNVQGHQRGRKIQLDEGETEVKTCWQPELTLHQTSHPEVKAEVHQPQRDQGRRKNQQAYSNLEVQRKTCHGYQYQDGFSSLASIPHEPTQPPPLPWKENQHLQEGETHEPPVYQNTHLSMQQKRCQPKKGSDVLSDKSDQTAGSPICQSVEAHAKTCYTQTDQRTSPTLFGLPNDLYEITEEDDFIEVNLDCKILSNSWSTDQTSLSSEYHTALMDLPDHTNNQNNNSPPSQSAPCPLVGEEQTFEPQPDQDSSNNEISPVKTGVKKQHEKGRLSSAAGPPSWKQNFHSNMEQSEDHKYIPLKDHRKHTKEWKLHQRSLGSSNPQLPGNFFEVGSLDDKNSLAEAQRLLNDMSLEPNRLSSCYHSAKMDKTIQTDEEEKKSGSYLHKLSQMSRLQTHPENDYSKMHHRSLLPLDLSTKKAPESSQNLTGLRRKFELSQAPPDFYANFYTAESVTDSDSDEGQAEEDQEKFFSLTSQWGSKEPHPTGMFTTKNFSEAEKRMEIESD